MGTCNKDLPSNLFDAIRISKFKLLLGSHIFVKICHPYCISVPHGYSKSNYSSLFGVLDKVCKVNNECRIRILFLANVTEFDVVYEITLPSDIVESISLASSEASCTHRVDYYELDCKLEEFISKKEPVTSVSARIVKIGE